MSLLDFILTYFKSAGQFHISDLEYARQTMEILLKSMVKLLLLLVEPSYHLVVAYFVYISRSCKPEGMPIP